MLTNLTQFGKRQKRDLTHVNNSVKQSRIISENREKQLGKIVDACRPSSVLKWRRQHVRDHEEKPTEGDFGTKTCHVPIFPKNIILLIISLIELTIIYQKITRIDHNLPKIYQN